MVFVRAEYESAVFEGEVFYRFEDAGEGAGELVLDYVGRASFAEEIGEDEWVMCEGWPMYVAYPEFGSTFIFAIDVDLDEEEEVADIILANVQSWAPWIGAVGRE